MRRDRLRNACATIIFRPIFQFMLSHPGLGATKSEKAGCRSLVFLLVLQWIYVNKPFSTFKEYGRILKLVVVYLCIYTLFCDLPILQNFLFYTDNILKPLFSASFTKFLIRYEMNGTNQTDINQLNNTARRYVWITFAVNSFDD